MTPSDKASGSVASLLLSANLSMHRVDFLVSEILSQIIGTAPETASAPDLPRRSQGLAADCMTLEGNVQKLIPRLEEILGLLNGESLKGEGVGIIYREGQNSDELARHLQPQSIPVDGLPIWRPHQYGV